MINLDDYRKRKERIKEGFVLLPVYKKIYMQDDKLIGEFSNGKTEIIHNYSKD